MLGVGVGLSAAVVRFRTFGGFYPNVKFYVSMHVCREERDVEEK